jgi:hypothetical protein
MKNQRLSRLLAASLLMGLIGLLAIAPIGFADEATQLPDDSVTDSESDRPEADEKRKFDSRVRLTRTVLFGDREEIRDLNESLERSEALLQRAIDADAEQDLIDRIQAEVDRNQIALDDAITDRDHVKELIADLSPEQVFAYNRSLNNAIESGLLPYLDSDLLERSLGADLNRKQINAVTQALEQEARFAMKAERLRDRAEETGNDRLLAKADKMEDRGEAQKEKFLARVSGSADSDRTRSDLREEGRMQARVVAKNVAKQEARRTARENAREEARVASRDGSEAREATRTAKREAIQLARATAREEARANGRGQAKRKNN